LADHSREEGVLKKPGAEELRPWERAPASGYYQLLNGFGSPTGEKAFVQRGDFLPSAPRPLRWRLMHSAGDNRSRHAANVDPQERQIRLTPIFSPKHKEGPS
jgi:hypothetical protein